MRTLQDIIAEVEKAIEGREGFRMESIFPFFLHATRIDLNQIELVDEYCGTNLTSFIKNNGTQIDINRSLWSI